MVIFHCYVSSPEGTGCLAKGCTKAKAMNARPSRALMSHIDGDFNWVPQFWMFWVDEWMSGDQYWNWKKENWNWTITHVIECDHINRNLLLIKNIDAYTNTTSRACCPDIYSPIKRRSLWTILQIYNTSWHIDPFYSDSHKPKYNGLRYRDL